jgi:large subunit ribosomal protein L22
MGKQANPRTLSDSEAKSVARNLRVSPQKLNLVAAMIRGMDVNKALATLTFSRRRISGDVKKSPAISHCQRRKQPFAGC